MNSDLKKAILYFGGAFLVFFVFKKFGGGSKKTKKAKTTGSTASANGESSNRNAVVIMKAYRDAKQAGESRAFLQEMNQEFQKEYGLRVMTNKSNGKLIVVDSEGNKVI